MNGIPIQSPILSILQLRVIKKVNLSFKGGNRANNYKQCSVLLWVEFILCRPDPHVLCYSRAISKWNL